MKRGWRNEHPTEALPETAAGGPDPSTRTAVVDALSTLAPRLSERPQDPGALR